MSALNSLISEAIDVVVHCARTPRGLRVMEIVAVEDQQTGPDATAFTITEIFRRQGPDHSLQWTGAVPVRLARALEGVDIDITALLDDPHEPDGRSRW